MWRLQRRRAVGLIIEPTDADSLGVRSPEGGVLEGRLAMFHDVWKNRAKKNKKVLYELQKTRHEGERLRAQCLQKREPATSGKREGLR